MRGIGAMIDLLWVDDDVMFGLTTGFPGELTARRLAQTKFNDRLRRALDGSKAAATTMSGRTTATELQSPTTSAPKSPQRTPWRRTPPSMPWRPRTSSRGFAKLRAERTGGRARPSGSVQSMTTNANRLRQFRGRISWQSASRNQGRHPLPLASRRLWSGSGRGPSFRRIR